MKIKAYLQTHKTHTRQTPFARRATARTKNTPARKTKARYCTCQMIINTHTKYTNMKYYVLNFNRHTAYRIQIYTHKETRAIPDQTLDGWVVCVWHVENEKNPTTAVNINTKTLNDAPPRQRGRKAARDFTFSTILCVLHLISSRHHTSYKYLYHSSLHIPDQNPTTLTTKRRIFVERLLQDLSRIQLPPPPLYNHDKTAVTAIAAPCPSHNNHTSTGRAAKNRTGCFFLFLYRARSVFFNNTAVSIA